MSDIDQNLNGSPSRDPLEFIPEPLRQFMDMRYASQKRRERIFYRIVNKYPNAVSEEKLRKLAKAWNITYPLKE